jgi:hypothetical protein
MGQFRALGEAMGRPDFKSFVNGRGVEIAFDKEQIKEIILIVVFAPIWTEDSKEPPSIRFDVTCYPEMGIPIHLFTLRQFSLLLLLLDTLPDFLLYLSAREMLHGENLIANVSIKSRYLLPMKSLKYLDAMA